MSTSLRLSKEDDFTEDAKIISNERECAGFNVDLLAGRSSSKAQNFEGDSDTLSEDDENDTSDDDRKIADNPVLKERLRHLDKYASSFRYDAESQPIDNGLAGCNEHIAVDYGRSTSVDERTRGPLLHESISVQKSIKDFVSKPPSLSMLSEKKSAFLYSVQCIGGGLVTSPADRQDCRQIPLSMGFSGTNYENHPSVNSNCDKLPEGDSDKYECELCGAIYTNRSSLRSHLKKHAGQIIKRHLCQHCPYSTQYEKNLIKHIKSTHVEAGDCKHHCDSCGINFSSDLLLKKHDQTHSTLVNYQCEVCGRTFKTKLRLKYHTDTHNPRKPYICDVDGCDRAFRTPKYLKNHRDEFHHMQPKQYLCPVDGCTLIFHRKTHLKRHVATHEDAEKRFHCTWPGCQRRFRTKESLNFHFNMHTGENPFNCDFCSFTCQDKGILVYHICQKHLKTSAATSSIMSPVSNSFAALHRPLPPPPVLQTTAGGGILPASSSNINDPLDPIGKDESLELFSPSSPLAGQRKNDFLMNHTISSTSVPRSASSSVSPDQQNLVGDSTNSAHVPPSLLAVLQKTADLDPDAPESAVALEYARSLLPPFVTGKVLDERVDMAVEEVIASLEDQPIHVMHAVFASSRALSSDELHMVHTLENQLSCSSGAPLVAPAPLRKRGRRPKMQQLLQPYLERLYNLEPCTAEAMAIHLVSQHNSNLSAYLNNGRGRGRGRGRRHSRGPDGVHWLPVINEGGGYDRGGFSPRGQYIGAVRRGGPGSSGGRGRGAYRIQMMDFSASRQFGEMDEEEEDDAEGEEDNEEEIDGGRTYVEGMDETDPSIQLRRNQKMLNDSEVDDEQELDNLGVDEEIPEQDQDALDDQSMDLRKTAYSRTSGTPMRSLGMHSMDTTTNNPFEGRDRDGLGEVLDLGCIRRHSAVGKREAALYLPVDVVERINGEVDVCSRRSSATATPSHGPVPLPSMAALASTSTSPADIAPGSAKAKHRQIGPASAASASNMSPVVGVSGGKNQRPPSRPLAHQTSIPEYSQVTSPILRYPSSSTGVHCNPPSVSGLDGMGSWSESGYGSSSQEAYKQAPPNVFLHTSPNSTLKFHQQHQQQHPGGGSPEFHHLQREQVMSSTSPSQRVPTSNPYLAHQQQHNHKQASPPPVAPLGDAVDHLRSLSALGAKYTQPPPEPIDLGEQRDPHPILGSTSLGSLLSGEVKLDAFLQFSGTSDFRSNSFENRSPQSRGGNLPSDATDNHAPSNSSMYPEALTHRQATTYVGGDGMISGGSLFGRIAAAAPSVAAYSINEDYYRQLQAHSANSHQLLATGTFNTAYTQGNGGGSNIHLYPGGAGTGSSEQLDLSVSTGNRSFQQSPQQQQSSNSHYASEFGVARFDGSGGDTTNTTSQHPYYNTNARHAAAQLPPPLGMYDQNYHNCYPPNNSSLTAAAVAAAAYNYHYQQQQQQLHPQETDLPYDRVPYDYERNRYLF